jgi:hypothetical protein
MAESKAPETPATHTTPPTVVKKVEAYRDVVLHSGGPGFPFTVTGVGFGDVAGKLRLGGRDVKTTMWREDKIKGVAAADLEPGETELAINDQTLKVRL